MIGAFCQDHIKGNLHLKWFPKVDLKWISPVWQNYLPYFIQSCVLGNTNIGVKSIINFWCEMNPHENYGNQNSCFIICNNCYAICNWNESYIVNCE